MWKASAGTDINLKEQSADDDWDTDPDFINDVTEQEQRWGSRTVEGSGRVAGTIDMGKLRLETEEADKMKKQRLLEEGPNPSFGYGGKFGVEVDRMDRSAVGHDYVAKVEKHASQKDYTTGFGGKFGVQTDRVDKSAVSWDHREKIEKHASQRDYASGFGGKFGVEKDRQDKSAVGWDHVEKIDKHESQIDYTIGFGGKFGIQADRQDKCAVGWDHHEAPQKHESQLDHKIGFGGKFGVQTDRMDKSAVAYTEPQKVGTNYTRAKPDIGDAKPADLRAKFEHMGDEAQRPKEAEPERRPVKQLDTSKTALFADKVDRPKPVAVEEPTASEDVVPPPSVETTSVRSTEEAPNPDAKAVEQTVEQTPEPNRDAAAEEEVAEFNVEDTGLVAIALFDYQSAADDEISFDPDDIITHVEMIDEGWWRGLCRGKYGLFPANYVQLHQ